MAKVTNPLSELFAMVAEEQKKQEVENENLAQLSNFVESLVVVRKDEIPTQIREEVKTLEVEDVSSQIEKMVEEVKERALAELKEQGLDIYGTSPSVKTSDPLTPFDQKYATKEEMQRHYTNFLTRIQQQLASIGGGGEVKFLRLDDVARQTANDNWLLEYDAATGKVQFTNQPGPVDLLRFDTSHTHEEERIVGTLCWSPQDQTLNLQHPNGVTQQVGQETYAYIRNQTGNTIPNGTVVGFVGAEQDGGSGARLLIGPYLADGALSSLYVLGVATEDIIDGADGRATVWGKVRDLDMSDFNVGDILYASTTEPGKFTNVKPTAPNNVIPVAAVLNNSNTAGEIFVRPTIEQQEYYGRFTRLTNQTANTVNTAYAVQFDTTEISNGIVFNGVSDTQIKVIDSGYYQFDVSIQITASSNKGIAYFWFRKNGTDIPHSTRSTTVTNGDTFNVLTNLSISLDVDDYVEVMWARSASGIFLDARAATAFAPSAASVMLSVVQVQL